MDILYTLKENYKNGNTADFDILKLCTPDISHEVIYLAAEYADSSALEYLLDEFEFDIKNQNNYGDTLLHRLAECGNNNKEFKYDYGRVAKSTKILLERKSSFVTKNNQGSTAYHIAAGNAVTPMLQVILDAGIKMGMPDKKGRTVLHLATHEVRFIVTYLKFAENKLEDRIKSGDDISETIKEITLLKWRMQEYAKTVNLLLNAGFDKDAKSQDRKTPLDYAVEAGANEIAAILSGNLIGKNLIQACIDKDIVSLGELVDSGADLNEEFSEVIYKHHNLKNITPLGAACMSGFCDGVIKLVSAGADPDLKNTEENKPVYYLIKHAKPDFEIEKIINALKMNINESVNNNGDTALNLASYCNISGYGKDSVSYKAVSSLLKAGCDINKSNNEGLTPIMNICKMSADPGQIVMELLLEQGADLSITDKYGNTPAMHAVKAHGNSKALNFFQLMSEFGDLYLEKVNNDGKNALQIAIDEHNEELAKIIISLM